MVLKIRLARFGRRNAPFYNIVIAHARYGTPNAHPARLTPVTRDATRRLLGGGRAERIALSC